MSSSALHWWYGGQRPKQPYSARLVRIGLFADGVHAALPGRRCLPRSALAQALRPGWPPRALSEVRAGAQVPPHQDPRLVHVRLRRAPHPPDEGHDLREVHDVAAAVVLRRLSDDEYAVRHLRKAARARDRRPLRDCPPDDEEDPHGADEGRWRAATRRCRDRRDLDRWAPTQTARHQI